MDTATSPDQRNQVNRLPRATYRLQLRRDFGFKQIAEQLDYLSSLGISDLYLSPLFHARADSQHGYDVVDPNRIEPAFGDREQLQELAAQARQRQIGVLLDIVPNHMGINDPDNELWNDVLENGPNARSAIFFDIDWNPPGGELVDCVLLPFLGKPFGETLEAGEVQVRRIADGFVLQYFERRFPMNPASWTEILRSAERSLPEQTDATLRDELSSIRTQLASLNRDDDSVQRYREQRVARRRLRQLFGESSEVISACDAALTAINGSVGVPTSFDTLERILHAQFYRLAYWRVAVDEINYRRFFDINDLAAVRVENERVYEHLHRLTWDLIKTGVVTGLRVDHIDGLLDPADYFERLQRDYRECAHADQAEELYIVAEKILSGLERLHTEWPISGTTGYEFLNLVSRRMVDEAGVNELTEFYRGVTQQTMKSRDVAYRSKRAILSDAMASELNVLASELFRIARSNRRTIHFTQRGLLRAVREVIACFPVYRTYVRPRGWEVSHQDHVLIREALRWSIVRNPTMPRSVFDFISSVLLLEFPPGLAEEQQVQWRDWVLRFQQVTGPVTAKGIEDTSFYRYFPLLSLNEVGAELGAQPLGQPEFDKSMVDRCRDWPRSLSATGTHDTKRGEDMRARIHVLSECPEKYIAAWEGWEAAISRSSQIDMSVDANTRYFIFQTLLGTWPTNQSDWNDYQERLQTYFLKAFREAKQQTSWRNPNEPYESAVANFVRQCLADRESTATDPVEQLANLISGPGFINSISQVVLKSTLPGVPDFYQGCEFWDFHLVDPDNRQPIDFQSRATTLQQLHAQSSEANSGLPDPTHTLSDPALKMFTTLRCLNARRDAWDVFASGDYRTLSISGDKAEHVIAFQRCYQQQSILVVVPRLPLGLIGRDLPATTLQDFLGEVWGDTAVALEDDRPSLWHNLMTDRPVTSSAGRLALSELFSGFCAAILFQNLQNLPEGTKQ